MSEKIALCRMFSGEYWKNPNNIGYESINMFLPDGQKQEQIPVSYMYLPANGDYDIKNIDIKYVLLTQHIAKKVDKSQPEGKRTKSLVKVIGLAKVKEENFKNDYKNIYSDDPKYQNYICIGGGSEFDKMQEVFLNKNKADELYKKAEILAKIHERQNKIADTIKYSGKTLKSLFGNNTSFGDLNILLTLKVEGLSFPKENIYLTNDEKFFSNFVIKGDKVIIVNSNPSSQKQTTYIEYEKSLIEEILRYGIWESATELNIEKFEKEFEPSFLTLIGKENDEISYSNLFAHFLASPDFCEKFFNFVGLNKVNPTKIDREESNIDILVKSINQIVVVENKIKSALNGHSEEDINGEEYRDQLKRYYEYVEGKYKNAKYYIFAPDYNPVNQENFGIAEVNGNRIKMKDVWQVIRYSEILEFCENYSGFNGTPDEWNFNEFKKALKVHTVKSLQNYHREMQIRMRKLFN